MTEEPSWFKRFLDGFGKVPEGEPRELIPKPIRMPVFAAMVVVSLIVLALLLWLVVVPAIRSQQAPAQPTQTQTQLASVHAEYTPKEIA